jgi:hypothetical protein
MQRLCRILCVLGFLVSLPAYGGEVRISLHVKGAWPLLLLAVFAPRYAPPPSPHHISAAPKRAAESCTFVAGVRHCPLPNPGAEPR